MFGLNWFVCQELRGNKLSGFYVVKCLKCPSRQRRYASWTFGKGGKIWRQKSNRKRAVKHHSCHVATLENWWWNLKNHPNWNWTIIFHPPIHLHFIWPHLPVHPTSRCSVSKFSRFFCWHQCMWKGKPMDHCLGIVADASATKLAFRWNLADF